MQYKRLLQTSEARSFHKCTVNETIDVAIDLSGKLIEIYVKPLLDRYIAQVGNFIKAILKMLSLDDIVIVDFSDLLR